MGRFSITFIRQHARLRNLIEAIPEPRTGRRFNYWMDGSRRCGRRPRIHEESRLRQPDAAPVRLIPSHRVKRHARLPTGAVRQLRYRRLHHSYRPRGSMPGAGGRPSAATREIRECLWSLPQVRAVGSLTITASGSTISPRAAFAAQSPPGWRSRLSPTTWLAGRARLGLGEPSGDHQDPPAAVLLPRRTAHQFGAPPHFRIFQSSWPWENQFSRALARLRALPLPALTGARLPLTRAIRPTEHRQPDSRHTQSREGHFLPTAYRIPPAMAARPPTSCRCGCPHAALILIYWNLAYPVRLSLYPSSLVSTTGTSRFGGFGIRQVTFLLNGLAGHFP